MDRLYEKFWIAEPYQLVPLLKNAMMSKPVEAVVVIVGAVPAGHLTLVNVAVRPPVESCTIIKINDLPAVAVGIVKVQLPVSVTV